MSRSLTNAKRGKGKSAATLPAIGTAATAQNIQNFDGRSNASAGVFEIKTARGTSDQGQQVQWQGVVK